MDIFHLALGGCLKAPPISFGITADTGGHIAYVLEAAIAQSRRRGIGQITIVTRLFEESGLDPAHARPGERIGDGVAIERVATANRAYLEKERLAADLPAFTEAFCAHLARRPRLPDVIHAHFADAAAVAIEARRRFGIPVVYTPHALGIDKRAHCGEADGLDARIATERAAIAAADAIIVSTRDEAERQVSAYGIDASARAHRIAPGIPAHPASGTPTIADRLGEWLDDAGKPILLAIARPVAKKNLAGLLRAYAGEPALRDRANLVILAGQHDGPISAEERAVLAELRRLASLPALAGRVALPVAHDAADVAALYARAADGGAFVNPALHEPFGLTLVEAAAAGVPVVATRNGGPAEIVATIGHGLLVDPEADAEIAAACLAIVGDAALHARLATAARANATRYDWNAYAEASVALYRSLARRPGLLACDIDGTLTGCVAGAAAFAEWRRATQMPFVVATGRSLDAARAVLSRWRLPEPDAFITDVGTRIVERVPGGWRECPAYRAAIDEGWDRAAVAAAIAPLRIAPQGEETAGPHKLSFFGTAGDAARIREALEAKALAARVIFSHGELIDVLAPRAGKAAAVAAYAARSGLTPGDCVAAGDSGNDLDMLEACGHAIVVANADAELDALAPRPGLLRVAAAHAAGVMEGLALLGLAPAHERAAA